ncbi:hypothetical protein J6590_097958 [Homalodisca vitripennis]|nr:hypothetical protein J6590_097958 [Homalodisca vitripennis]
MFPWQQTFLVVVPNSVLDFNFTWHQLADRASSTKKDRWPPIMPSSKCDQGSLGRTTPVTDLNRSSITRRKDAILKRALRGSFTDPFTPNSGFNVTKYK